MLPASVIRGALFGQMWPQGSSRSCKGVGSHVLQSSLLPHICPPAHLPICLLACLPSNVYVCLCCQVVVDKAAGGDQAVLADLTPGSSVEVRGWTGLG